MRHFIFSFGSLAHKAVAERTATTLSFYPAYLHGYARNFRVHVEGGGFSAAGIEKLEDARTLGMLAEVSADCLSKFDEREHMYDRVTLDPALIRMAVDSKVLPEGEFHLYVPREQKLPTDENPVVQSYIDVIVQAFIPYGDELVEELIQSFHDLKISWLNDRDNPRYQRFLENAEVELIDEYFAKCDSEFLPHRMGDGQGVLPKPELLDSVLKTITFYDLFDFPLMAEEIMDQLYQYSQPLHIKELKATLAHLVSEGRLSEIKQFFVFPGRESLIETRKSHKFIAEKFWTRTKLYSTYITKIPFVKMIAVCNSLAYDNPNEQSDIDLFIVVKEGRMWLSRALITMVLQFFGVRRHGKFVAGRFCLSFFVTPKRMSMAELSLESEDPYLAYWTKNLAPIYGQGTYEQFMAMNSDWLASYGLEFSEDQKKHFYFESESSLKRFFEWLLNGFIGNIFEGLLKKTFKKRTLNKMRELGPDANVIVEDDILKFHNKDRRREYYEKWRG